MATPCHLELEREAEERPDQHDAAQHRDALGAGRDGNGADDVCGNQEFEAEKDRAAQAPPEKLIGTAVFLPNPSNRQEDSEYGTTCDDGDTDGIDRLADSLDDLHDRHAVMVSPTSQLSGRHAGGGRVDHLLAAIAGPRDYGVDTLMPDASTHSSTRDQRQHRIVERARPSLTGSARGLAHP
jgi:hypothetical protein